MKILVTSDTHGMHDAISDYILTHDDIDLLIHAGDGLEDVEKIYYETGISYYAVKGNNDYFIEEDYDKVINLGDKKIFLSHGHRYNIDFTYENILEKAKKESCDIIIFGHIHKYVYEIKNGILLLNPGSPYLARDGFYGFIILEIDDKIKINRIELN